MFARGAMRHTLPDHPQVLMFFGAVVKSWGGTAEVMPGVRWRFEGVVWWL